MADHLNEAANQAANEAANEAANDAANERAPVIQPGYTIGDRVLRPAQVGVSKGGPRTAPVEGRKIAH